MTDYTNKDVVERLDLLIALMKLSNLKILEEHKKNIQKDIVSDIILKLVDDEPMDYSTLAEKTAKKSGKSERTVKSRIAELTDKKILSKKRESGKTFYFNSGILE